MTIFPQLKHYIYIHNLSSSISAEFREADIRATPSTRANTNGADTEWKFRISLATRESGQVRIFHAKSRRTFVTTIPKTFGAICACLHKVAANCRKNLHGSETRAHKKQTLSESNVCWFAKVSHPSCVRKNGSFDIVDLVEIPFKWWMPLNVRMGRQFKFYKLGTTWMSDGEPRCVRLCLNICASQQHMCFYVRTTDVHASRLTFASHLSLSH